MKVLSWLLVIAFVGILISRSPDGPVANAVRDLGGGIKVVVTTVWEGFSGNS